MKNKPWKNSTYYHVLPDYFSSIACKKEIDWLPAIKEVLLKEYTIMGFKRNEQFSRTFFKVQVKDLFPEESKDRAWFSFDEIIRKASEQGLRQLSVTSMMHLFLECKEDNKSSKTQWQKGEAMYVSATPLEDGDVYRLISFDCFAEGSISLGGRPVAMVSSEKTDFSLNSMTTVVFEGK